MEIIKLNSNIAHIKIDESNFYFRDTEREREVLANEMPESFVFEVMKK